MNVMNEITHSIECVGFWIMGAFEFRSDFGITTDDCDLNEAYDSGREFMHWITFRRYDK